MDGGAVTPDRGPSDAEASRSATYRLLSRLLAGAPDAGVLDIVSTLHGDPETELGAALSALATQARDSDPAALEREYFDLFIGLGRGELVPFASYYLTGFMNEKPLARLRRDMAVLGVARADGVSEPEDHAAAVLDIMAGLIEGEYGDPADLTAQRAFFETHVAPWMGRLFADLEKGRAARFYAPVGTVGRLFVEIETKAFLMEV